MSGFASPGSRARAGRARARGIELFSLVGVVGPAWLAAGCEPDYGACVKENEQGSKSLVQGGRYRLTLLEEHTAISTLARHDPTMDGYQDAPCAGGIAPRAGMTLEFSVKERDRKGLSCTYWRLIPEAWPDLEFLEFKESDTASIYILAGVRALTRFSNGCLGWSSFEISLNSRGGPFQDPVPSERAPIVFARYPSRDVPDSGPISTCPRCGDNWIAKIDPVGP